VIADVGTGSGAIAIAIARHLPTATIYATDRSHEALLVAGVNRRRHGVTDRVHLVQGDLLGPLREPVDVIVSNPPYLTTEELARAQPEIRREPRQALDGGEEGLDITRRLLRQARGHLRPEGLIVVEIAPQQLAHVTRMGAEAFPAAAVSFSLDLSRQPRLVSIMLPQGTSRPTRRLRSNDGHETSGIAGDISVPVPG
jgi:release factor glutamine methyltransferase